MGGIRFSIKRLIYNSTLTEGSRFLKFDLGQIEKNFLYMELGFRKQIIVENFTNSQNLSCLYLCFNPRIPGGAFHVLYP